MRQGLFVIKGTPAQVNEQLNLLTKYYGPKATLADILLEQSKRKELRKISFEEIDALILVLHEACLEDMHFLTNRADAIKALYCIAECILHKPLTIACKIKGLAEELRRDMIEEELCPECGGELVERVNGIKLGGWACTSCGQCYTESEVFS